MNPENIHCSHQSWADSSSLPCQIFDQWLEDLRPPTSLSTAISHAQGIMVGKGEKSGLLEAPDGSGTALPGNAGLQQQVQGNWRWEELVTTSSMGGRAEPSRAPFLSYVSSLPFPRVLPCSLPWRKGMLFSRPGNLQSARPILWGNRTGKERIPLQPCLQQPLREASTTQNQPLSPKPSASGS